MLTQPSAPEPGKTGKSGLRHVALRSKGLTLGKCVFECPEANAQDVPIDRWKFRMPPAEVGMSRALLKYTETGGGKLSHAPRSPSCQTTICASVGLAPA